MIVCKQNVYLHSNFEVSLRLNRGLVYADHKSLSDDLRSWILHPDLLNKRSTDLNSHPTTKRALVKIVPMQCRLIFKNTQDILCNFDNVKETG